MVAENVSGIVAGNAKGYVNLIVKRFKELGYDLQIFKLNAATMDVPQARERIFFIANRMGYPKLQLHFDHAPIKFGEVRSAKGKAVTTERERVLLENALPSDRKLEQVIKRLTGESGKYFSNMILWDGLVAPTITSAGSYYRMVDRSKLSDEDFRIIQSFPRDYNFKKNNVQYVCGMSVPPNMMANIAKELWNQWLKSKK